MPSDDPGRPDRETTRGEAASEGTRTASTESPADIASEPDRSAPDTRRELLAAAERYAATVDIDVDLDAVEWELSERAKRRAGTCLHDEESGEITIRLTWRAYRELGWDEMRETIRHELVHAWEFQRFGEAGHGARFRAKARELDAPRHCGAFTEPRLRLVCASEDCEWTADRHRASKTVTHPERRRCGACGGEYEVRHLESGESWTTNDGYRAARDRIDPDW